MFGWGKKPPAPGALTGVGAVLNASHRPPHGSGPAHDHTWEITAWFVDKGTDATFYQGQLEKVVAHLEGTCLPDTIARNETLAAYICEQMSDDYYGINCVSVVVSRTAERLYARWPA
jgi:hypothetical protein